METLTQLEHKFLEYLQDWQPQHCHSYELQDHLGISDSKVRCIRHHLQEAGIQVASDKTGYWYEPDRAKWEANLASNIGGRALSQLKCLHTGLRRMVLNQMIEMEFSDTSLKPCNEQIQP